MKVLFLDESGDHNLTVIDHQYPMFVLGGVIMDKDYAETELPRQINALKHALFGRTDIILHTADLTRNQNGFERMKERPFREKFYAELNRLMRQVPYMVVACAIRKGEHTSRYGVAALDPYLLSLNVLVERFCFEIGNVAGGGVIVAEKRNPNLDHELEIAWLNLKVKGTPYVPATDIEKRVIGLNLRAKSENIAGLELAYLVVSPIGRHVLGKPDKEDFRIIASKFRHNREGIYEGYGLVVLPK